MNPKRRATIPAPRHGHATSDIVALALFNPLGDVKFRGAQWPFVQWQDSGLWIR